MEQVATITEDATLSVDDLIMKIGMMTVELMQKERELVEARKAAQAQIASVATAASKDKAETEELRKQLLQAKAYKDSHDALSAKYNDLSAAYESMRKQARLAEEALAKANAENSSLRAKLAEVEASRSQLLARITELEAERPRARRRKQEE